MPKTFTCWTVRLLVVGMLMGVVAEQGGARAQGLYLGAGLSGPTDFQEFTPKISVQAGVNPLPMFGARVSIDSIIQLSQFSIVSADALYRYSLPLSPVTIYVGGGPEFYLGNARPGFTRDDVLGVHATGGAEFRLGQYGLYGELQPGLTLSSGNAIVKLRVGVNLHF